VIQSIGPARSSKSMSMRVGWGERREKDSTTTEAKDEKTEDGREILSLGSDLSGKEKRLRDV
jgi:hypothetical protein